MDQKHVHLQGTWCTANLRSSSPGEKVDLLRFQSVHALLPEIRQTWNKLDAVAAWFECKKKLQLNTRSWTWLRCQRGVGSRLCGEICMSLASSPESTFFAKIAGNAFVRVVRQHRAAAFVPCAQLWDVSRVGIIIFTFSQNKRWRCSNMVLRTGKVFPCPAPQGIFTRIPSFWYPFIVKFVHRIVLLLGTNAWPQFAWKFEFATIRQLWVFLSHARLPSWLAKRLIWVTVPLSCSCCHCDHCCQRHMRSTHLPLPIQLKYHHKPKITNMHQQLSTTELKKVTIQYGSSHYASCCTLWQHWNFFYCWTCLIKHVASTLISALVSWETAFVPGSFLWFWHRSAEVFAGKEDSSLSRSIAFSIFLERICFADNEKKKTKKNKKKPTKSEVRDKRCMALGFLWKKVAWKRLCCLITVSLFWKFCLVGGIIQNVESPFALHNPYEFHLVVSGQTVICFYHRKMCWTFFTRQRRSSVEHTCKQSSFHIDVPGGSETCSFCTSLCGLFPVFWFRQMIICCASPLSCAALFQETCLTCCYRCSVSTRSTCAITTTVCRCWLSASSARSSTSCCAVTRRSPSARAAPWRPFSHTLCIR